MVLEVGIEDAINVGDEGRPSVEGEEGSVGGEGGSQSSTSSSSEGPEGENQGVLGDRAKRGLGRRKGPNVTGWKKHVAKQARNLGQAYTSYTTKKPVAERKIGPACNDGCFDKVGMQRVQEIFANFWEIGDYDRQNQYLQALIKEEAVKRKRTTSPVSRRTKTYHYCVKVEYKDVQVCKKAFISIHGISAKKIQVLMEKRQQSPTGAPVLDQRGKRPSPQAIRGPTLDYVHEHIQQLPVYASHYSRVHAPYRRYMETGVTADELHKEYAEWMRHVHPEGMVVSPRFYRTVFTTQYNIVFTPPKTDLCSECEKYKAKINANKELDKDTSKLEADLATHEEASRVPQEMLSKAECESREIGPDSDTRTIAIDLQQTLPCPRLRVSVAYYKRKVWLYNFCVYDLNKAKANMFLWDETQAERGSDEIASCIIKWMDAELAAGSSFKRLRIFADNCAGQNKNKFIMMLALRLVHSGLLERFEMIFMVPGHSYLPCDRAFGHIEKRLKKKKSVYCPDDYARIIQKAVTKENVIFRMQREDLYNVKFLEDYCTVRHKPGISAARQLVVDSSYKEGYVIRNHYNVDHEDYPIGCESDVKVSFMPGRGPYDASKFDLSRGDLPLKYPIGVKLDTEKLTDLKSMKIYLDTKGRKWVNDVVKMQAKVIQSIGRQREAEAEARAQEEAEDDPDYAPEGDPNASQLDVENNAWEYCPPIIVPEEHRRPRRDPGRGRGRGRGRTILTPTRRSTRKTS